MCPLLSPPPSPLPARAERFSRRELLSGVPQPPSPHARETALAAAAAASLGGGSPLPGSDADGVPGGGDVEGRLSRNVSGRSSVSSGGTGGGGKRHILSTRNAHVMPT